VNIFLVLVDALILLAVCLGSAYIMMLVTPSMAGHIKFEWYVIWFMFWMMVMILKDSYQ
jgi:hypothetical protein